MKTITKMALLIILLSISKIYGQYYSANDYFSASRYVEIKDINNYSASTIFDFSNSVPKVFNVHFYGLETTDGNLPSTSLNDDFALERIAALNIAFNPYNIFFKYRGFSLYSEIYNGSELVNQQDHDQVMDRMYEVAQDQGKDNNINIILHHTSCNNYKGSANIYKKIISLWYCTSSPHLVVYQMAHLLGLMKIYYDTVTTQNNSFLNPNPCGEGSPYTDRLFFHIPNPNLTPENVTRDITNPDYNANTHGDMVTDTPAAFAGSEHNFCHLGSSSTYDYISHPNIVDESSEQLMYENLDMLNWMCLRYNYLPNFERNHFTNGQGVRMRETIAIPSLNFNNVSTTISALYEPYKIEEIETISNDIYSLTDNGDGTAEVCRTRSFEMKHSFQPGFDYDFYGYGMSNFDHHVDKTDLYGILDTGYYKFLKINQISDTDIIIHENTVCDLRSGVVCVTEPYSKGNVLSSTNLANPNPTIKVLNSQEASDPNLEQNLENNQFHVIEKTTISGAKIQKIIYKNGN